MCAAVNSLVQTPVSGFAEAVPEVHRKLLPLKCQVEKQPEGPMDKWDASGHGIESPQSRAGEFLAYPRQR